MIQRKMIHSLKCWSEQQLQILQLCAKNLQQRENYFAVYDITKCQLLAKLKCFKYKLMKKYIKLNRHKVTLSLAAINMINIICKTNLQTKNRNSPHMEPAWSQVPSNLPKTPANIHTNNIQHLFVGWCEPYGFVYP